MIMRLLDLSVSENMGKYAREALSQYRNICASANIASMETVVNHYLDASEEKLKLHAKESDLVEDLDFVQTPENLLLSSISEETQARELDTTWLRFHWNALRACLDLLKNNQKLQSLYQSVARRSCEFCAEYSRKVEFRRLCELMRSQLHSIVSHQDHKDAVVLAESENLEAQLEIRFTQLSFAVKLGLWQEAFKTVEDIQGLISMSEEEISAELLVVYYKQLAMMFRVGNNFLFHAAFLRKLLALWKEIGADESEEYEKVAKSFLLAALCIPTENKYDNEALADMFEMILVPSRSDLVNAALLLVEEKGLLQLYSDLEISFDPLHLCEKVQPVLVTLERDSEYSIYVKPLIHTICRRLIICLSKVYSSFKVEKISSYLESLPGYDWPIHSLETFVVHCCKGTANTAFVDQSTHNVYFSDRNSIPFRLNEFCEELVHSLEKHDSKHQVSKTKLVDELVVQFALERQSNLQRQEMIKKKKEAKLSHQQEKERLEASEKARKEKIDQEIERQRLAEESKKREEERIKREMAEIKRQEAKRIADDLRKKLESSGQKVEELENLSKETLLLKQMEQEENAKKEMDAKLLAVWRRVDHTERAYRQEENEFWKKDFEIQKVVDQETKKSLEEFRLKESKAAFAKGLAWKNSLQTALSDLNVFEEKLKAQREEKAKKRLEEEARMRAETEKEKEKLRLAEEKAKDDAKRFEEEKAEMLRAQSAAQSQSVSPSPTTSAPYVPPGSKSAGKYTPPTARYTPPTAKNTATTGNVSQSAGKYVPKYVSPTTGQSASASGKSGFQKSSYGNSQKKTLSSAFGSSKPRNTERK